MYNGVLSFQQFKRHRGTINIFPVHTLNVLLTDMLKHVDNIYMAARSLKICALRII